MMFFGEGGRFGGDADSEKLVRFGKVRRREVTHGCEGAVERRREQSVVLVGKLERIRVRVRRCDGGRTRMPMKRDSRQASNRDMAKMTVAADLVPFEGAGRKSETRRRGDKRC